MRKKQEDIKVVYKDLLRDHTSELMFNSILRLMANNTGIILVLAYPETIVMVAEEWYSPFLKYLGVGKKDYLRAGHAALVLIDKEER